MSKTVRMLVKIGVALGVAAGLGILLAFLAGVFNPKVPKDRPAPEEADRGRFQWAEVRLVHKPREESAGGTVRPEHEAAVASQLLGRVTEVKVKAGQEVQLGDELVRLDDAILQARYKQAEAEAKAAQANHEQAIKDYNIAKNLLPSAIPKQDYEKAVTRVATTKADETRCQQAWEESKAQLAYATIKSPMTGTVFDKKVQVGDTVLPGQVLVTMYNTKKMQMLVNVRESLAQKLHVGQKLRSRLEALGHECEASIGQIVPETQTGSHTFIVKVVGPCPPGVFSGMFGRIFIPLEEEEIVIVPAAAVKRVGQLEMVQVLEEGKVHRRNIQTGRSFNGDVEVLAGLKPQEKVAVGTEAHP